MILFLRLPPGVDPEEEMRQMRLHKFADSLLRQRQYHQATRVSFAIFLCNFSLNTIFQHLSVKFIYNLVNFFPLIQINSVDYCYKTIHTKYNNVVVCCCRLNNTQVCDEHLFEKLAHIPQRAVWESKHH